MPYPPPPGPPDVGEFQAIGKLPAPELPDVTGHGGEFLETDGIIPQWEPISGVLPDQTGHAGEFLTTDGAVASWAPGGGGGGITTIGTLTTPTANAAVITGGDTLQLAPADATNPGVLTTTTQRAGGLKLFQDEATTSVYDVRLYGAVANDTTNDFAQAFYNALANSPAGINSLGSLISGSTTVSAWIPEGNFYTSMPLCTRAGTYVRGAAANLTGIAPGTVATAEGVHVAGFAGPVFSNQAPYTPAQLADPANALAFPSYSAPLVGAIGQSLVLTDDFSVGPLSFPLHESFAWCGWLSETYNLTSWSLQFWVKIDDSVPAGFYKSIIGSAGPSVWSNRTPVGTLGENNRDTCFAVWAYSDTANCYIIAVLTTNPNYNGVFSMQANGTLHYIKSAAVSTSSPLNIELDYDGSHFDLFIDGVSHGHVTATGPIVRQPWEGVAIGTFGAEALDTFDGIAGIKGKIDSIRLSKVARHTGTGSFTPPASKYTWDSNTMALYNWDQGWKTVQPKDPTGANVGPLLTLPFLVGQTVSGNSGTTDGGPPLVGPVPHFIRLSTVTQTSTVKFEDFAITGWNTASGIFVGSQGWRTVINRVWAQYCSRMGFAVRTGTSFYSTLEDCFAFGCTDYGFQAFGEVIRPQTQACGIAVHLYNGLVDGLLNQPTYKSYTSFVVSGVGSIYNQGTIRHSSNDAEVWNYSRQVAAGIIDSSFSTLCCSDNTWDAGTSNGPSMLYFGIPNKETHTNDVFVSNQANPGTPPNDDVDNVFFQFYPLSGPDRNISLYGSRTVSFRPGGSPLSNFEDWVSQFDLTGATNFRGLSVSDLAANNLSGTFSVLNGFITGGPTFNTPEPDGNYIVNITPQSYQGSAPATGSTRVTQVATSASGFVATLEADPGGTCQLTFAYTMVRQDPPAEYYSYLPTIPSSFSNPLTEAEPFGVGFTLVPSGHNAITYDETVDTQALVSAGTYASSSFWEVNLFTLSTQVSGSVGAFDDFGLESSRVVDGKLLNILNPGAHNIVMAQSSHPELYLDGTRFIYTGTVENLGSQPATIHVGERADASKPLTTAILRNLKVSRNYKRCFSADSDIGPRSMAQAAFIGDEWTVGASSAGGLGGFAQQIGSARYGTAYYWMGSVRYGQITSTDPAGLYGVVNQWFGAQTAPAMSTLCLMAGWEDILVGGKTAAEVFAAQKVVLEGTPATATWTPPTSANNRYAVLIYRPPQSAGTDTFTFAGTPYSIPFTVDAHTTATNAASILNAAGTFNTSWSAGNVGDGGSGIWALMITSKVAGSAGNGITATSAGVGTALVYGDIGGGITGTGLSAKTFAGTDVTTTIAGVVVPTNFDTDADTTVNNFIAAIAGDGTLGPLVTGTLSSHKMVLVANANGWAGNNITIGASFSLGSTYPWTTSHSASPVTLEDGANGAITSGIPNIVFCNVPPMKGVVDRPWSAGIEAQRVALNALIAAYVGAGVTIADVNAVLVDPGDSTQLNPIYNYGNGWPNNDGHMALFTLLAPLLPGVGTAPSALSYASNPVSYANGAPIAANSPTVTGSVVRWTVSPPLPAGLSISSTTGDITGTPTTPTAAADYTVGATNTAGTITVAVNITIT